MERTAGIYARGSERLDRYVQFAVAQARVISVSFPETPDADAAAEHDLLDRLEAYLDGEHDEFEDVQVALTLPTPQREVLETVQRVPYGQPVTVDQLARMVPDHDPADDPDAAIREALAANPAPVFVPTHRVLDGPGAEPADVARQLRNIEGL